MRENVSPLVIKEPRSHLNIGAFTFIREHTGRVVLHVDVASGLYPLRMTHEQTYALAQWLLSHQEEIASEQEFQQSECSL